LENVSGDASQDYFADGMTVSTGHGISPVLGAQNSPLWRGW
jgi:hypothetical protein